MKQFGRLGTQDRMRVAVPHREVEQPADRAEILHLGNLALAAYEAAQLERQIMVYGRAARRCRFRPVSLVCASPQLLERNPKPSAEDVRTAISGNICRCATYPRVLEAVVAASQSKGA